MALPTPKCFDLLPYGKFGELGGRCVQARRLQSNTPDARVVRTGSFFIVAQAERGVWQLKPP